MSLEVERIVLQNRRLSVGDGLGETTCCRSYILLGSRL